jgi:3-oxo-5-alpha-steroid 4-dehydrogenase 1
VVISSPYRALVALEFVLAIPTFVALRFIAAPYGRYRRAGWGPTVPSVLGWIVMESPASLLFAGVFLASHHGGGVAPLVLLGLWELHYAHRAFLYPIWMRPGARMPVGVVGLALGFNVLNAWINARWVAAAGRYPHGWLADPRFIAGAALFLGGFWLNVRSDHALRRLRGPGESGYRIPHGGAFEWVSCPNYLGEMTEWAGWALASWSPAGLAFATYTIANLAPRALTHHRWYRDQFPEYPPGRRALIPYLL